MNQYGVIINSIGMQPFVDALQRRLQPMGELLYPGPGHEWDGHHSFVVKYTIGEDVGLDMHTDDSDVTFNVCLGKEFTDGVLQVCGRMGEVDHRKAKKGINHVIGRCIIHLGKQRHGAKPITSGERMNFIMWMRSSTYRRSLEYQNPAYRQEEGPPDETCLSYTHDRDYGTFKEYDEDTIVHRGRGWCPPGEYEYENFVPEGGGNQAQCECCGKHRT